MASNVELRKIQITGGSTHVVSLPKKWVDRSGLGRSDTLAIHEEPDGSLLIVPHSDARPRRRRIAIELPNNCQPEDAVRRLVGAYLAGADEIVVKGQGAKDPQVRRTVRAMTRDLVGVEVLEETREMLVLQDLVGVSEMDLRKTMTRMHRIAGLMFDEALAAWQTRDLELAKDVTARDDELDRLEWMVSKQMHALLEQPRLAARLNVRPAEALNYFLVARSLERMGDHASKMCKNIAKLSSAALDQALIDDVVAQGAKVKEVWEEAFAAMKRGDFERGSRAVDAGKDLAPWRAQFPKHFGGLEPEVIGALTLIADSLDRTRGYAIDISEIGMNHTFQPS